MNDLNGHNNYRILIIDDRQNIHEDIKSILCNQQNNHSGIDSLNDDLFDEKNAPENSNNYDCTIDSAYQGEEGLEKVKQSLSDGHPFTLAFVDMRMPPGWDGLKTIEEIWKVDPNIQMVICTAYSEHSWQDIINRLNRTDALLILKKPFDYIEVKQLACALTAKWSLVQRLRTAKEKAEEMIHLKTDFMNIVSHELKTPLAVILSNISFLTDEHALPEPAEIREISKDVEGAARTLYHFVDAILDISEIECGRLKLIKSVISAGDIVKEVCKKLKTKAMEKSIHFTTEIEDLTILADPKYFKKTIFNLIHNAIKFTEKGNINVVLKKDMENIKFMVSDTGCGIHSNDMNKIFDPFRQLEDSFTRSAGGIGLGLAIVKKLVDMQNGTLSVESQPGHGSKFSFVIPIK